MQKVFINTFGNKYELDIVKHTSKETEAETTNQLYKGKVKNGKANGPGVLLFKGKNYLEGTWKDGFIVKGKFYDHVKGDGKLRYDGQFKDGVFDGKGMMVMDHYDETYHGQFKKGKKNGDGVMKDENNIIILRGTWKNDILVYGKEYYDESNKVLYDGHANGYKTGEIVKHGKGTYWEDFNGNEYFVGTFKNNSKEGKGAVYKKDGNSPFYLKSEGIYKRNLLNGLATDYWKSGKIEFKGQYVNGRRTGRGKRYHDNEKNTIEAEGNFLRGRLKGKAKTFYPNGKIHKEGIFDGSMKSGKKYYSSGTGYEIGNYDFGRRHGMMKIYYDDKLYDKGKWDRDYREGLHYMYHANGKLKFKGYYKRHSRDGKGKEYWENGNLKYDGNWKNDNYDGTGKKYYEDGKLAESGTFYSGRLKKGTKYYRFEYHVGTWNYRGMHGKCTEYWGLNKKKKSVGVWKDGEKNGEFSIYFPNGKLEFKGRYEDDKKNGKGTEYHQDGSVREKGYWKEGKYVGTTNPQKEKQAEKKKNVEENDIKKYMQTKDSGFLKKVSPNAMKEYLKKYAKKQIKTKTKASLLKELQKWRKELKEPKIEEHNEPMVFDAYEGTDVPIREFLEEDNRVILISENGHAFGTYLEQCEIVYECQSGRSFYNYIGRDDVHAMIQFPTAAGPKFYFDISIDEDLKKGFNLFHFKTEPKDLKVLSKNVAAGGSFVSGLHCDPKDVIKHSVVIKKEKEGSGLKKTVDFTF